MTSVAKCRQCGQWRVVRTETDSTQRLPMHRVGVGAAARFCPGSNGVVAAADVNPITDEAATEFSR